MSIKTDIDELLARRIDRKGFIRYLFVGLIGLTGIGWTLRTLKGTQDNQSNKSLGYGDSAYGGAQDGKHPRG